MKTESNRSLPSNTLSGEKRTISQNLFPQVFLYTAMFMLAAHGYRYFNVSFSHDSMLINSVLNNEWQISLGRFLQPIYLYLRGGLVAPYLIGIFSTIWLSLSAILIVKLLKLRSTSSIVLLCGLLTTWSTLTISNATYLAWSDMFMLSLLFSVTAVYCFTACRFWYIFTPLLLCASVGLYQAYYQVAVLLMIILLIKQMFEGESFQNLLRKSLISVGTLLLGLIVYYVLLQIVYQITGVVASDSYNGLTAIGNYADESIIIVFIKTYLHVAKSFILPETHNPILVATANVIIIISALLLTFIIAKKRVPDTKNKLLLILIIAFMPFGANVVHFIAKFEHSLMTFSFVLFYAFALLVSEEYLSERMLEKEHKKHPHVVQYATILLGTIVILNGLVFSNQAYFKKDLEYQATQLTMNRIMSRMESVEGYQVGRTPVVFIGRLDQSPYAKNRPGFEHLDALGLNNNIAVTYYKTYEWYLEQLAGYPLNLLPETEAREIATTQDVKGMPPYPEVGFCKIIDDTLVVKLSDGWHYTQSDVSM